MTNPASEKIYVLDTNILFELSLWLPIDLNKPFWTKFEEALQNGKWVLLDVIVDEVRGENDGLKKWCENQKRNGFTKPLEDLHRTRATEINNQYPMIDETTLRSTVDTYLIAYAEAHKLVVFSREGYRKKPEDLHKIPDVCKALNLEVTRKPREFFEMLGYKN
jgi:hypothetical protein